MIPRDKKFSISYVSYKASFHFSHPHLSRTHHTYWLRYGIVGCHIDKIWYASFNHHISVYGKIFLGLSHSCTSLYKLCKLKSDKLTSHVRNLTSELVKVSKGSLPLSTWLDVWLHPPWTWPLSMGYHSFVNTARRRHWQWRDNLHIVVGTATIKNFWVANFMRIVLCYHDRTNPH